MQNTAEEAPASQERFWGYTGKQSVEVGWSAEHYQRIAEAHWDRYPMGYWLWMRCAEGAQR